MWVGRHRCLSRLGFRVAEKGSGFLSLTGSGLCCRIRYACGSGLSTAIYL